MKTIVIAGGTGFLGNVLIRHFSEYNFRILTRGHSRIEGNIEYIHWDGHLYGPWAEALEGSDVLINLTGRSVDCRYTPSNRAAILGSRVGATRILGEVLKITKNKPEIWINASSATIYRDSRDKAMDEYSGETGSGFSEDVCTEWEKEFNNFELPGVRKVLLRTGLVFGRGGGPLKPLSVLARLGLGGKQGDGGQMVSWIHEADFAGIVQKIISDPVLEGTFNVTAPDPVTNSKFMKILRKCTGMPLGIHQPKWLLEIGAWLIRTETELVLKSRYVIPRRLLEAGYRFRFADAGSCLRDLTASS